jgi:hypothetical protein
MLHSVLNGEQAGVETRFFVDIVLGEKVKQLAIR